MNLMKTVGRVAFGGYFAFNGVHHFRELKSLKGIAAAKGVDHAELKLQATGALLIASGLSLAFNIKPRAGAAGIILFLAGTAVKMHNFWDQQDLGPRYAELAKFSKNMGFIAAAMAIGADDSPEKTTRPKSSPQQLDEPLPAALL